MSTHSLNVTETCGPVPFASGTCWYAIHTYFQNEKKIVTSLQNAGMETFLPVTTELHQWSDRKKRIDVPLFPGYAFVRMVATVENCARVCHTPRVLRLLGSQPDMPTPVPDAEIDAIRLLTAKRVGLSPHAFLEAGQKVRICGGSLDGVEGVMVRRGNDSSLVVSVNLIHKAVAFNLQGYRVEPI